MYSVKETAAGYNVLRPNGTLIFSIPGKSQENLSRAEKYVKDLNERNEVHKQLKQELGDGNCRN